MRYLFNLQLQIYVKYGILNIFIFTLYMLPNKHPSPLKTEDEYHSFIQCKKKYHLLRTHFFEREEKRKQVYPFCFSKFLHFQ